MTHPDPAGGPGACREEYREIRLSGQPLPATQYPPYEHTARDGTAVAEQLRRIYHDHARTGWAWSRLQARLVRVEHTPWEDIEPPSRAYLATCLDCRPPLPLPFSDAAARDAWAEAHAGTGHRVERCDP